MSKRRYRQLLDATALAWYVVVVVSGIVRITGSEVGCPGWPLCGDSAVPASPEAWFEVAHRVLLLVAGTLLVFSAQMAWRVRHVTSDPWVWKPPLLAAALLVVQMGAGALVLLAGLEWLFVVLTVGLQTVMLACVVSAAVSVRVENIGGGMMARTEFADEKAQREAEQARFFRLLVLGTTLASWILVLIGGTVAGTSSGIACTGFPDCNGELIPTSGGLPVVIHMTHRMTAYVVILLLLGVFALTVKDRWRDFVLLQWVLLAGGLLMAQATIGGANSLLAMPPFLRALHLAVAAAYWASIVVFALLVMRRPLLSGLDSSGRIVRPDASEAQGQPLVKQ